MGGLGIGSIMEKNMALLFKWIWRFFEINDFLWKKLIFEKFEYTFYRNAEEILIFKKGGVWCDICKVIKSNF